MQRQLEPVCQKKFGRIRCADDRRSNLTDVQVCVNGSLFGWTWHWVGALQTGVCNGYANPKSPEERAPRSSVQLKRD